MSETNWKVGDRVAYTTTGRHPTKVTGKVVQIERQNGTGRGQTGVWVHVKDADGQVRKTRPGPLKAA